MCLSSYRMNFNNIAHTNFQEWYKQWYIDTGSNFTTWLFSAKFPKKTLQMKAIYAVSLLSLKSDLYSVIVVTSNVISYYNRPYRWHKECSTVSMRWVNTIHFQHGELFQRHIAQCQPSVWLLNLNLMQVIEILPPRRQGPTYHTHVNTMAADDLAPQGARASAAMILTMFPWKTWSPDSKDQENPGGCCSWPGSTGS